MSARSSPPECGPFYLREPVQPDKLSPARLSLSVRVFPDCLASRINLVNQEALQQISAKHSCFHLPPKPTEMGTVYACSVAGFFFMPAAAPAPQCT